MAGYSQVTSRKLPAQSTSDHIDMLKRVITLAFPVMLTNSLQSLVNVADVFMVGRLGPIAIAAVGMGAAIRMLVLVMMLSVAAGSMSLIAQAKGGRDPERMSFVTRQAISSGVLISVVLTIGGLLLARPLLQLSNSGGDPLAVEYGVTYLTIIFSGTVFMVLNIVLNKLMQGAGDTVTPLFVSGGMNLLNIFLNYLFIFGPGPFPEMGVAGAALGTVMARGVGVIAAMSIIYSGKNVVRLLPGSYMPDWQMFRDILMIGVPSGVQGVFRNGSRLLLIGIVTSTELGSYGAAALAIGFQVESLVFMPGLGINVASTSLVGQALGSWQTLEARRRGNMGLILGLAVMTVLAAPIVIFAPSVVKLFDPSAHPVLLEAGTSYMRISTVALPLAAIAIVANGALRGAGDTIPGMISTLFTRGLISVVTAYVLALVLDFGSIGVWIAIAVGTVTDAIYMGLRWRSDVWYRVALHKTELYRKHLKHLPEDVQQQYLREIRTPYMAQPGTQEQVSDEDVVYTLPDGDVRVLFGDNNYKLQTEKAKNAEVLDY